MKSIKTSIIVGILLSYSTLNTGTIYTMEKLELTYCELKSDELLKTERTTPSFISAKTDDQLTLYQAVTAKKVALVKNKLTTQKFTYLELIKVYTYALMRAKKVTPNELLRSDRFLGHSIQLSQSQREKALDKLPLNVQVKINETLVHQGQIFLACAQEIYCYVQPFLTDKEKNKENISALFFLIGLCDNLALLQEFVKQYTEQINWNFCNEFGKTLLHTHAAEGNVDIVEYLLKNKIDCNKQSYKDSCDKKPHKTALHYAAEHRQLDVIKLLLHYKSDPNIEDAFGDLPIHYVAPGEKGHQVIFEMLLDAMQKSGKYRPIDNAYSGKGKTLLHEAVIENKPEAVEYLLNLGASVHKIINSQMDTILEVAITQGQEKREEIELLNSQAQEIRREIDFRTHQNREKAAESKLLDSEKNIKLALDSAYEYLRDNEAIFAILKNTKQLPKK